MKNRHFFPFWILVSVLSLQLACKGPKTTTNLKQNIPPTGLYAAQWAKVDSLADKRLPKSALEEVNQILAKARAEEQSAQIVKALLYRERFQTQVEENEDMQTFKRLEEEIAQASGAEKAVLQSILGEVYANYLRDNQYRIQDRTETENFDAGAPDTWTVGQLRTQAQGLYNASVKEPVTKDMALDTYSEILTPGVNTEDLRPTLYDFLAHRAIDFYNNTQNQLDQPTYQFYLDNEVVFADIDAFLAWNPQTKDTKSNLFQAIQIYQDLFRHLKALDKPEALLDADLKRLEFAKQHAVLEDKSDLYLEALAKTYESHKTFPTSSLAAYKIASLYQNKGNEKKVGEPNEDFAQALEWIKKAKADYPESYGAKKADELTAQILRKELVVRVEQVNLPEEPMLTSIQYRNLGKLYHRIVALEPETYVRLRKLDRKRMFDYLTGLTPVESWETNLPEVKDYATHITEIKLNTRKVGYYALITSDSEVFTEQGHVIRANTFFVSNLAYWTDILKEKRSLSAVHRKTGQPLANVKVEVKKETYNNRDRRYRLVTALEGVTDVNGKMDLSTLERGQYSFALTQGRDKLDLRATSYFYRDNYQPKKRREATIFLDRGIYRPGQRVYFKALFVEKDEKAYPGILPNEKMEVQLLDANNQEVEKLSLTTNDYGTVNGSFDLPKSGLAGQFRISANGSVKYFRVEEYKRPKFEVTFDPVTESYRLNDEVTVTGGAKAYAGNQIDGAKVSYRVVRETRFPYFPYWRYGWGYRPSTPSTEIAFGETTTDEKGKFEVTFPAKPDRGADPKYKPEFSYKIYADVVDITRETHSSETTVRVGNIAATVSITELQGTNPAFWKRDLPEFNLVTQNLNGQFEALSLDITVDRLKPMETYMKNRFWQKPDQPLMNETAFKQAFPHFAYQDEDQWLTRPVEATVWTKSMRTEKGQTLNLKRELTQTGIYKITIKGKDRFGQALEWQSIFQVNDVKIPLKDGFFAFKATPAANQYQPGEVAKTHVSTHFPKLYVAYSLEHQGRWLLDDWLDVAYYKGVDTPIKEMHRGNLHQHFVTVFDNRGYQQTKALNVPYDNKKLEVSFETFRDKLLPGQEEEWRITISGPEKDQVVAEMVATMYDASLDAFVQHGYSYQPYPIFNSNRRLNMTGFAAQQGDVIEKDWNRRIYHNVSRNYPNLKWFGYDRYGRGRNRFVDSEMMVLSAAPSAKSVERMAAEPAGVMADESAGEEYESVEDVSVELTNTQAPGSGPDSQGAPPIRKNLEETVFFFPELQTNAEGDIVLKFKMKEALTRWNFLGFAHTKDLKIGTIRESVVTQKELMIQPNPPRFLREFDELEFTAKVSNLTEKDLTGVARLDLMDALTQASVNTKFGHSQIELPFTVKAGQSAPLSWKIKVPAVEEVAAVLHRVTAQAGRVGDGEESALPVLTNRMLLTETMPLPIKAKETKTFLMESMEKATRSQSLSHQSLTLEFTSNPAWLAVKSLPYLMEYPYECTEQLFNRYYANSLATNIANSNPNIKRVYDKWRDRGDLTSNLMKNQELKTALIEDTPWVLGAQSEEAQMKNVALLFDLNRMASEQQIALSKIAERQQADGGFAWFGGRYSNWYITQYLLEGLGHLDRLKVINIFNPKQRVSGQPDLQNLVRRALQFSDEELVRHYRKLKDRVRASKGSMEDDHLDPMAIHYLYMRSFFPQVERSKKATQAFDYYLGQAKKYWTEKSIYNTGMIGLALHRQSETQAVNDIMASLNERALHHDELGMYWKYNRGYYWYQLPIETHSLMIELFDEVTGDANTVDELQIWLLKNKQTTHWKTTKATSAAIYALLLRGADKLAKTIPVEVTLGGVEKVDVAAAEIEPGTGYFKQQWDAQATAEKFADPGYQAGKVEVTNPNDQIAWGHSIGNTLKIWIK